MTRVRVVQFNMQFGQGWDESDPDNGPVDLEATIAEIRRHDADVILLQEVEQAAANGVQREPPPNYLRLQQAMKGYDSYFAYPRPDVRELPFGIGLAIFSRTPLRDVVRHEIPSPPVEFDFFGETKTPTDRVLIGARTRIEGRDLMVYNTHLLAFFMLKSSSEVHGGQRRQVGELLRQAEYPTLLAGDFNVSRPESLMAQYRQFGFETVQSKAITWRRHPYVLDHIFHNGGLRCLDHAVVPTPVSDHHLLRADFEFTD